MGGVVLGLALAVLVAATGLATAAVIGIRMLSELGTPATDSPPALEIRAARRSRTVA